MNTGLRDFAVSLPWAVLRRQFGRITVLLILAASGFLVWWSVSNRLLPVSRQVRDESVHVTGLASEVQEIEMNWKSSDADETERRFKRAQDRVIHGDAGLAAWQQEMEREAEALGLQAAIQAGKSKPSGDARQALACVPVAIELRPLESPGLTNASYVRLVEFTRRLQSSPKRVQFVELDVHGSSNSVQHAKLTVEVWSQKTQP